MTEPGALQPDRGSVRREFRTFPKSITRRLAAKGYKIERRYVNLPTDAELWHAITHDEVIWVYQCWVIVPKKRKRAFKRAERANSGVFEKD